MHFRHPQPRALAAASSRFAVVPGREDRGYVDLPKEGQTMDRASPNLSRNKVVDYGKALSLVRVVAETSLLTILRSTAFSVASCRD